jgi:hypothetical protein
MLTPAVADVKVISVSRSVKDTSTMHVPVNETPRLIDKVGK